MNKSKLTPQDGDLFAMIREITKVDIVVNEKPGNYEIHVCVEDLPKETTEALTAAVAGRLGKRFISNETDGTAITYFCQYGDWKNYPEEIRTDEMPITPVPGTRYCRTLKEVDAIKVDRERLEDLQKFTGGGTMTIPRTPGAIAKYEFKDNHGIILTAPEFSYIVREESGKIYVMDYREFIRDFELKYNPDDFEQCENCETRLPYENMLHDGEGVPLCPECMEALKGNPDFELVGVIKIMEERKSQIYDHGFDNDHDRNVNGNGQLKLVVASLLANDSGMFVRQTNWHFDWFKKIKAKTEIEQLAICGAMIAAEIDRLESERLLNPEGWQIADKSFNRYPDGTKAKGDAGEIWVKVPGGWKDEKTGKVDPHLGANWTGEILIPSKMNTGDGENL